MRTIIQSRGSGMSDDTWILMEHKRRMEKALAMKLGDFHEELAGKLKGYVTLANGDPSGCDVAKEDGSEIWEFKNRENTLNSKSARQTIQVLTRHHKNGVRPFLVFVNSSKDKKTLPRFGAPEHITVMNGQQAYAHISGRPDFFDDIRSTLAETFKRFPTYVEIQRVIRPDVK